MSRLGMPDLGVATLNDMRENASMIANLDRGIPLIADADTGYGGVLPRYRHPGFVIYLTLLGALMVGRTTEQYIQAGVAAFHLEDQVVNKRCGHLKNKEIVDEDVYLSRIRAAVNSRASMGKDIIIIARTDALQTFGYDAAISRLKKAIEIGADIAFLEGITSKKEGEKLCKELSPTPVMLNMVSGGITPKFTVAEARETGFKLILYPGFALGPVYQAVSAAAKELMETGDNAKASAHIPGMGPRELFMVCGLKEAVEFDTAAGGGGYSGGI